MVSDTIKVYVRFRPLRGELLNEENIELHDSEINNNNNNKLRNRSISPKHFQIINNSTINIHPITSQKIPKLSGNEYKRSNNPENVNTRELTFKFDECFSSNISQSELYNRTILPILPSFLNGYNITIICYGQTGSGKTYTMTGGDESDNENEIGIIPRLFKSIFLEIDESPVTYQYTIGLSYFEIYNESIIDLLNPKSNSKNIFIREIIDDNNENKVYVEGLEKIYVASVEDVQNVIKIGNSNKTIAETNMNDKSSRSHTILRIELNVQKDDINKKEIFKSTLFLVDLAGSERLNKSGNNLLKETININSSLSALSNVINSLSERDGNLHNNNNTNHIPYRDSKLTRILQNSIGGNAKTAIIINCSSDSKDLNETISSLRFAQRAKNVYNSAIINKIEYEKEGKESKSEDNGNDNEETKTWKSKYINALKKIVQLETELESMGNNEGKSDNNNNNNIDNNYQEICRLSKENIELKNENIKLNETIEYLRENNDNCNIIDIKISLTESIRKFESLKSDIEIYKKLLVSKTDQILQLESDKLNDMNNSKIYKEMTNTIQLQNDLLIEQVEIAERELRNKQEKIQEAMNKLNDRNKIVNNEQENVENKLQEMSKRLNNISKNKVVKIDDEVNEENNKTPINHKIGTGLNLNIIKPC